MSPGQLRVPVAVFLDNPAQGVRALQFTLTDSPDEVALAAPTPGSSVVETVGRAVGMTCDANEVANDIRVVCISTGSARIAPGSGQILNLFVDDKAAACAFGSVTQLVLTASEVADDNRNPVLHTTVDGSLRCGCRGDIDSNGHTDIFDALSCVDFVIQRRTPTDAERSAADLDGNGRIDIFDCLGIVDIIIGRRPACP